MGTYFKTVRGTGKGGVDVELGPKTLIFGKNGRGKSAIQNHLELATRGFVSDIGGRDQIRKHGDIHRELSTDGETLEAVAVTSDGVEFKWKTVRKKKSIKKEEPTCPMAVAWPVLDIEAKLKGNPETRRKWLLSFAGQATREQVHDHITNTELYDMYAEQYSFSSEGETLTKVLEVVTSECLAEGKDLKALETTVEVMGQGLAPEVSEEDIAKLVQTVESLQAAAQAAATQQAQAGFRVNQTMLDQQQARALALYQKLEQAQQQLHALQVQRGQVQVSPHEDLIAAVDAADLADRANLPNCVMCGSPAHGKDWQSVSDSLASHVGMAVLAAELDQKIQNQQNLIAMGQASLERATAEYKRLAGIFATQAPLAPVDTSAIAKLQAATTALNTARSANNNWTRVRDQREQLKESKAKKRELDALKEDCQKAVKVLVKGAFQAFQDAVNAHLPDTDDFVVQASDDNVTMGFMRDGRLHTALSGAEWARETMAISAAYLRLSGHKGLSILTPRERAFDPETLAETLRALSDAPGQVIFTSPIKPAGRRPKGWTYIEVE